eukprot:CAMPEP_0114580540 /NCGR_PEP_ID=MMETSP0125-20121206/4801_1 /TAXON_ID=485358 ORGANISM="Aristerostoma sp., Strain ATCC 50986" /NCGR_SAMPLE_ID=MMETSP0125 /ASSEMBLY_ACC=CAM_ASM_000245 /LENGTH=346 /DNA_ID=CAMNT_0001772155 /DNA_START=167 /DNA_END=1206 /DNA_ORIENTATION=-
MPKTPSNGVLQKETPQFYDVDLTEPTTSEDQEQEPKPQISVLSYNILAEAYSDSFSSDVHPIQLSFAYRSKIVIEEIKKLDADIFFLQEVDNYYNFYKNELKYMGYEVIFNERRNKIDGIAVGFRKKAFELISSEVINLDTDHIYEKNPEFRRGNIAIVAHLKHLETGKIVHVLGTHFFWNPRKEHIKYLQMSIIMQYFNKNYSSDDLIIWGGDLNSKPNDNNVNYVSHLIEPTAERMEFFSQEGIEYMKDIHSNMEKNMQKKISFDNAYEFYGAASGNKDKKFPKCTNFTTNFKDTLDHIFFNNKTLKLKKLLKVPDDKTIHEKTLPNKRHPSDHLPIMCVFELK